MINNPLISIIVPCYKVEEFLPECVESVLNQTYPNWELILVDDGSPDRTGDICDEYATRDNRIKVVHKKNGGLVSARNAGYDVVHGEWHTYLDGDDWLSVDTMEVLVTKINEFHNLDMIFWNLQYELKCKTVPSKWSPLTKDRIKLYEGDACVEIAKKSLIYTNGLATSCAKLINTKYAYHNSLLHDSRLVQGSEDAEFALRTYYNASKILYLNKGLYHYRYNPQSITKSINEKNAQYIADCYTIMYDKILCFKDSKEFVHLLYQNTLYAIISIALNIYFNPNNKECFRIRSEKFRTILDENDILRQSLLYASTTGMDFKRRIVLWSIKRNYLFLLDLITCFKKNLLKIGYYNY